MSDKWTISSKGILRSDEIIDEYESLPRNDIGTPKQDAYRTLSSKANILFMLEQSDEGISYQNLKEVGGYEFNIHADEFDRAFNSLVIEGSIVPANRISRVQKEMINIDLPIDIKMHKDSDKPKGIIKYNPYKLENVDILSKKDIKLRKN